MYMHAQNRCSLAPHLRVSAYAQMTVCLRIFVCILRPILYWEMQNIWSWSCACSHGLTFRWWSCCGLCLWHKPFELAHSFLFCSFVCFCLYGPFKCISFHTFSRQLSAFSLCSSGLMSALLVVTTVYLFMKVFFSPDIILCGWLNLIKHQWTY